MTGICPDRGLIRDYRPNMDVIGRIQTAVRRSAMFERDRPDMSGNGTMPGLGSGCMAIRNIRKEGDEVLRKRSREVTEINDNILILLDDMADTMYKANGAGLAAPQVGVLRRVVVIDIGEGLVELINPVIRKQSGKQTTVEGCLSIPGVWGEVERPAKVVVEALNRNGEKIRIEGEGYMAQALCHEIDHLDGILFTDKVIRFLDEEELEKMEQES